MTTLETNTTGKSPNCVSQVAPPIPPASTFLDDASADDDSNVKVDVSFSHVQLYVDAIEHLDDYKRLEDDANRLLSRINSNNGDVAAKRDDEQRLDVDEYREVYRAITAEENSNDDPPSKDSNADTQNDPPPFVPHGRDVIRQLIAGLGFRITAASQSGDFDGTKSVLLTTRDPNGVQIVVTALSKDNHDNDDDNIDKDVKEVKDGKYAHFDSANLRRFFDAHAGRQGIAVLAFEVTAGSIDAIQRRYAALHPKLLIAANNDKSDEMITNMIRSYEGEEGGIIKILEVYAYYQGDVRTSEADVGTVLRFVQRDKTDGGDNNNNGDAMPLPGLNCVEATFDPNSQAAYCDHWVSNVYSRTGFLDTLRDILGFVPKVDFNAGVVAAGEAQIESTVTGNDSALSTNDVNLALRDQSQVYLPINNALSNVGHVHGFLAELGQGVQHVASRVADLPAFVQRGNDMRQITGEGFTFLNIPRSYYGVLVQDHLIKNDYHDDFALLSPACAGVVMDVCHTHGIVTSDGAVKLDLSRKDIVNLLDNNIPAMHQYEYIARKGTVVDTILQSRYINLYALLHDHLSEGSYLQIVRNQILIDVQGDDLLMQIFTSNILQRRVGDEAPFFEFIQRVCSECRDEDGCPATIKPGCGGFGIRNFLTLFLSIEVSKAMLEASLAKAEGDEERCAYAQSMVDVFRAQLDESNPILTEISNAMTQEGSFKAQIERAVALNNNEAVQNLRVKLAEAGEAKAYGNQMLMECSTKYCNMMRKLRESRN